MHMLDIIAKKNFKSLFYLPLGTIFKLILQLQITWLLQNYLKLTLMPNVAHMQLH